MTEAEEYINSIPKFAGKTELKNTEILLDVLGIDTSCMKIIHVAGTNGKGSVCSFISNTLVRAGHRTGLFISPHLVKINERIQMDNIPVPDEVFNRAYEAVLEAAHRMEQSGGKHPAYFEFLFGMAMFIFKEQKAEYIVLETGMGGRLDSTNIIKKPLMTVITSVSMDHMHVLGNTIEEIAGEKAGIIKPGVPLVFYGGDERVRSVLEKTALERKTPYEIIDDTKVSDIGKRGKFIDFSLNNRYYNKELFSVQSAALYQVWNAALAATALAWLMETDAECGLTLDIIHEGIKTAFWEGRMEELRPNVYVDGAHNEDGIRAFLETAVSMKDARQLLMFSAVADKDYDTMIKEICESGAFDEYVVCTVEYTRRAMPGSVFLDTFHKYTDKPVYLEETAGDALKRVLALRTADDRVFIAGSLYLVGEIKRIIGSYTD
jgi:dihydrofolate synthase/folylpolyglutamate synthase